MTERDLVRFVAAQDAIWPRPIDELRAGAKRSHWMWFVFPQVAGLGRSDTARYYAIAGMGEARAYLAHPVLRSRLDDTCAALLVHRGPSAIDIFGGIDAAKLRSSMTLFECASAGNSGAFADVLTRYFGSERDPRTIETLGSSAAR